MNPSKDLKEEHEVIKTFTKILGEMIEKLSAGRRVDVDDLAWLFEFQREFIGRSHFRKEECLLFPAMKDAGVPESPLEDLVSEHEVLRALAKAVRWSIEDYRAGEPPNGIIEAGRSYISLMEEHMEREDGVFFPMIEQALPKEHLERICEKFARLEAGRIGLGRSDELEELLDYLNNFY